MSIKNYIKNTKYVENRVIKRSNEVFKVHKPITDQFALTKYWVTGFLQAMRGNVTKDLHLTIYTGG